MCKCSVVVVGNNKHSALLGVCGLHMGGHVNTSLRGVWSAYGEDHINSFRGCGLHMGRTTSTVLGGCGLHMGGHINTSITEF